MEYIPNRPSLVSQLAEEKRYFVRVGIHPDSRSIGSRTSTTLTMYLATLDCATSNPGLRFDWRGQDGHDETQEPDHSASLAVC